MQRSRQSPNHVLAWEVLWTEELGGPQGLTESDATEQPRTIRSSQSPFPFPKINNKRECFIRHFNKTSDLKLTRCNLDSNIQTPRALHPASPHTHKTQETDVSVAPKDKLQVQAAGLFRGSWPQCTPPSGLC